MTRSNGGLAALSTDASIHRLIRGNSLSNILRHFFYLALTFVLTPIIVKWLGDSHYGLWVVILSFIGYAGILEMGVQTAVVRLVSLQRSREDAAEVGQTVSAAFGLFLGIGVLCALVFQFVLPLLLPVMIQDPAESRLALALCRILSIDIIFVFLNMILSGAFYGFHRYTLRNVLDIVTGSVNAVLIILFLARGGLVTLAWIKTAVDGLTFLLMMGLWSRVAPGVVIAPFAIRRLALRELLSFGGTVFISSTMARLSNNAQPILIGALRSSAWTAFFAIPRRLVDSAREVGWALSNGFTPIFSELDGRADSSRLRDLYLQYTRYIVLLTLPLFIAVAVYGVSFISLWIGPEYAEKGRWALNFLALSVLVEGLQPLAWRMFVGVGRLRKVVWLSSLGSLGEIGVGIVGLLTFGIAGLAAVICAVTLVRHFILLSFVSEQLSLGFGDLLYRTHLTPLLSSGVFLASSALLARLIGRETYAAILGGAAISAVFYVIVAYHLALEGGERLALRARLQGLAVGGSRAC